MKKKIFSLGKKSLLGFLLISLFGWGSGLYLLSSFLLKPMPAQAAEGKSVSLQAGWNMISPGSYTISVGNLGGCQIKSGPWEWDDSIKNYKKADTLKPLSSYWVRIEANCTLNVSGGTSASSLRRQLDPGWNMIATTKNNSWNGIKGNCQIDEIGRLFWGKVSRYEVIDPIIPMEPMMGYFVKVKSSCTIDEEAKIIDIWALPGLGADYNCFLSQGSPANACGNPQVIIKDDREYCRHFDPKCAKNENGAYAWQCNYQETLKPQSTREQICTAAGWQDKPQNQDDEGWLKINLCNLLGSLVENLIGAFAKSFGAEVLAGLIGPDLANTLKAVVDFYFWLKAQGIDPVALAQNPASFQQYLDKFIGIGTNILKDFAISKIKDFVVSLANNLKIDPVIGQELGNLMSFLIKKGVDLRNLADINKLRDLLWEYVQTEGSPLLNQLLKVQQIIDLISMAMQTGQDAVQDILAFLSFLANAYNQTKNLSLEQIINSLEANFDAWHQAFISATGRRIEGEKTRIINTLRLIVQDVAAKIKSQFSLNDSDLKTLLLFIDFVMKKGYAPKDLAGLAQSQLQAFWQEFIRTFPDRALQKALDVILEISYSLISQAYNKIFETLGLDLRVDPQMIPKIVQLLRYLLFSKNLSFSNISVEIEIPGRLRAWINESGLTINVDESVIKDTLKFISEQIINVLQNNLGIPPEVTKYALDFLDYATKNGVNLTNFLSLSPAQFNNLFRGYIESRGKQILSEIVINLISPYINEALGKLGVDPNLVVEVLRFVQYLMTTKNLTINQIANMAISELQNIFAQYIGNQAQKTFGFPADVIRELLLVVIRNNLIQDILNLDIKAIVQKLTIRVEVNGAFNCPTDLMSALCRLLDGNNWKDCSVGDLPINTNYSPASHAVSLFDPKIDSAMLSICNVPNIYVSILGYPVIQGIDLRFGIIAYKGNDLLLEMPTHNNIKWGGGSPAEEGLYQARWKEITHTYPASGNYNVNAKCNFMFNIDIFDFHWPTGGPKEINKSIFVP